MPTPKNSKPKVVRPKVLKNKASSEASLPKGLSVPVYDSTGKEVGTINLPEKVFGRAWNGDLIHQVVYSMLSSRRGGTAHAKNRGEVRGGGRKPWQQKGTGRARHGSTRSPIWVGGGVTHGPRNEKNYKRVVPAKMKSAALRSILSRKLKDGEIFCIKETGVTAPKTKEAKRFLEGAAKIPGLERVFGKQKNAAILAIPSPDRGIFKSFRNIGNVMVMESRNLNPVDLLKFQKVLFIDPEVSTSKVPA